MNLVGNLDDHKQNLYTHILKVYYIKLYINKRIPKKKGSSGKIIIDYYNIYCKPVATQ